MSQKSTVTEHLLTADLHLEDVLEYLDDLHSAASDGKNRSFTGTDDVETLSVLRDIIYTAQEAVREIEAKRAQRRKNRKHQPVLRIIPKVDKAG